jgi:hypothetical protein
MSKHRIIMKILVKEIDIGRFGDKSFAKDVYDGLNDLTLYQLNYIYNNHIFNYYMNYEEITEAYRNYLYSTLSEIEKETRRWYAQKILDMALSQKDQFYDDVDNVDSFAFGTNLKKLVNVYNYYLNIEKKHGYIKPVTNEELIEIVNNYDKIKDNGRKKKRKSKIKKSRKYKK